MGCAGLSNADDQDTARLSLTFDPSFLGAVIPYALRLLARGPSVRRGTNGLSMDPKLAGDPPAGPASSCVNCKSLLADSL